MKTELYQQAKARLPVTGKYIIGYQEEDLVVVYQAYKPAIAEFAVSNQFLGGDSYSYDRMSWIKPGFLWMMYRSGWAEKTDQERILALWIGREDFKNILAEAVPTTYKRNLYENEAHWKKALKTKEVRVQWDPDHNPFGHKLERRAVQLGLSGATLASFGKQYIRKIEDVTGFAKEQKAVLDQQGVAQLRVPFETIMETEQA